MPRPREIHPIYSERLKHRRRFCSVRLRNYELALNAHQFLAVFVYQCHTDIRLAPGFDRFEFEFNANEECRVDEREVISADGIEHTYEGAFAAVNLASVITKLGQSNSHCPALRMLGIACGGVLGAF